MTKILSVLVFVGLASSAFAQGTGGKYPKCVEGRTLKAGDRFELQLDFGKNNDGNIGKVLYRMGNNSVLVPEFPRMASQGMAIAFTVKPNPNEPKESTDPKELDRMARFELEEAAKLKGVHIFCN